MAKVLNGNAISVLFTFLKSADAVVKSAETVAVSKKESANFQNMTVRLMRYLDFYAMSIIYIEVLTGRRAGANGDFDEATLNSVPAKVKDFVLKIYNLKDEEFSENTI